MHASIAQNGHTKCPLSAIARLSCKISYQGFAGCLANAFTHTIKNLACRRAGRVVSIPYMQALIRCTEREMQA